MFVGDMGCVEPAEDTLLRVRELCVIFGEDGRPELADDTLPRLRVLCVVLDGDGGPAGDTGVIDANDSYTLYSSIES